MNAYDDLRKKGFKFCVLVQGKNAQIDIMLPNTLRIFVYTDVGLLKATLGEILEDLNKKYYEQELNIKLKECRTIKGANKIFGVQKHYATGEDIL